MRISTSIVARTWHKHPIAYSVLGLFALGYAFFVAYFTSVNGLGELGSALLIPVPVVVGFFCMSAFPFWAVNNTAAGVSVLIGELVFLLVWGAVCSRRHYRPRALLWGFLGMAVINLALNFLVPNWAD